MLEPTNSSRDHLLVFINGERHEVAGADAFVTLSDFLHLRLGQVGTKIVCSEGDCGACSVLIGRVDTPGEAPGETPGTCRSAYWIARGKSWL